MKYLLPILAAVLAVLAGKELTHFHSVGSGNSVVEKVKSGFIKEIATALSFLFALAILILIYTFGENIMPLILPKQ